MTTGTVADFLSNPNSLTSNSFTISDTAANISANFDALQTNSSKIAQINLTGSGNLTLSANQLSSDAAALAAINNTASLTLTGTGSITSTPGGTQNYTTLVQIDTTSFLAGGTITSTIQLGSGTGSGSYDLYKNIPTYNSRPINSLANAYDVGPNSNTILNYSFVASATDKYVLGLEGNWGAIGATNSYNYTIQVTGSYGLIVNGVSTSTLSQTLSNSHVKKVNVSDTAVNITTNLALLQANLSKISTLTVTDTTTVFVTATQATADSGILALIQLDGGSYTIYSPTAGDLSTLVTYNYLVGTNSYALSDTANNIGLGIDNAQTFASKITSITLTSGSTLALSNTQYNNDSSVLGKIVSPYFLTLTGVPTSGIASTLTNPLVTSIGLSDTSTNVANAIDNIQTNRLKISSVNLTSGSSLSISATQLANDSAALALIASTYSLSISGVNTTNLAAVLGNALVLPVTLSDTASALNSSIDNLEANITRIAQINITSGSQLSITQAQLTNDAAVLSAINTSPYTLSVSGASIANLPSTLANSHVTSIAINDNTANVSSAFDSLQSNSSKINNIILTSGTTLSLSLTQLNADTVALSRISSYYYLNITGLNASNFVSTLAMPHVGTVSITDTASNISASIDTFQTNVGNIAGITLSSGTVLTMNATQLLTDAAVLPKINSTYTLTVSGVTTSNLLAVLANALVSPVTLIDSASNISASIDTLQLNSSRISAISLSSGTVLSLSASQLTSDAAILGLIGSTYSLAVSGVTTSNLLAMIGNARVSPVSLSDSASSIASAIDSLQTNVARISGITLSSGNTLPISLGQYTNDVSVLNKIASAYFLTVSGVPISSLSTIMSNSHVSSVGLYDTTVNVANNIDSLQTNISQFSSISLSSGNTILISQNQFTNDIAVLNKISSSYYLTVSTVPVGMVTSNLTNPHVTSMSITDTSTNVNNAIDALQINTGTISSINLASGTLSITGTQFVNDSSVISKIYGTYSINISALATSALALAVGNTHLSTASLSDSPTNVASSIDIIQANVSKISDITLSINTPLPISLTQLNNDATALSRINGSYSLTVSNVTTTALLSTLANTNVVSVSMNDTAPSVSSSIDTIYSNSAKVSSITITNISIPLSITLTQLTSDSQAINKIAGAYLLNVSSVSTSALTSTLTNLHVNSISMNDTASNIAGNIDALQDNNGKISSITVTDISTPLSITLAQLNRDVAAFNKIVGSYTLNVSGVTASSVVSTLANSHVSTVNIGDTASNINSLLDSLQSNSSKISTVTISDPTTPLSISLTQLNNDATVLSEISGSYTLAISGVTASTLAATLVNPHVSSIGLSDTATNIASVIDTVQANAGKVTSINITGSNSTLSIAQPQLIADATSFNKISGSYNLAVSGVTSSTLTSTLTNPHVSSVSISDTASNLASNLNTLQNNISKISSISVSNSVPLSVSSSQVSSDSAVLNLIQQNGGTYTAASTIRGTVSTFLTNPSVFSSAGFTIVDSPSNIASNFDALQTYSVKLAQINLTGSGNLTLNASQLSTDSNALSLLNSVAVLSLSGTSNITSTPTGTQNYTTQISIDTTSFLNGGTIIASVSLGSGSASGSYDLFKNNPSYNTRPTNSLANAYDQLPSTTSVLNYSFPASATDKYVLALEGNWGTPGNTNQLTYTVQVSGTYSLKINGVTASTLTQTLAQPQISSFSVVDTASNVAGMLNSLQSNLAKISSISISNSTPLLITSAQAAADSGALALIQQGGSSYTIVPSTLGSVNTFISSVPNLQPGSFSITDSAVNISSNIDTLQANVAKISGITITGSTNLLSISSAQLTSDTAVLADIPGTYTLAVTGVAANNVSNTLSNTHVSSVTVSDSTTNVASAIDALQSNNSKISQIALNSGSTLPITLNQLSSDNAILNKIIGNYYLSISAVPVSSLGSLILNSLITSISLSDTASNIVNSLDFLQSNVGKISTVYLTGNSTNLSVTSAQLLSDASIINTIVGSYTLSVTGIQVSGLTTTLANTNVSGVSILDSPANISSSLDFLQFYGSKVTNIALTSNSGTLLLTGSQLSSDSATLAKISSAYSINVSSLLASSLNAAVNNTHVSSINMNDSAANIASVIDTLQANISKLASINLNGNSITLPISLLQFNNDASVLNQISGAFALNISAVPVISLTSTVSNNHVSAVSLSDTANNIASAIDLIQSNLTKISSITFNGSNNVLALSFPQLSNDTSTLNLISGSYALSVSAVPVSSLVSTLANAHVTSVSISDTAANLANNLNLLQSNISKISSITIYNNSPLSVSSSQVSQDSAVLNLIQQNGGTYTTTPTISGSVSTFLSNISSYSSSGFKVVDTTSNIASNFDALQTNSAKLAQINPTGSVNLTLNASQLSSDSNAISLLSPGTLLSIIGVSASTLTQTLAIPQVASISVTDTASNIAGILNSLQSNLSKISSISISNNIPLLISSAQASADSGAIALIQQSGGSFIIQPSTLGSVNTFVSAASNLSPGSFSISDSAANIAGSIDLLQTNISKISGITITGSSSALSITASQLISDSAVLADIPGAYSLAISGVTANAATITLSKAHVASISVSDSSSNLMINLNALSLNINSITAINLTDNIPLVISTDQQNTYLSVLNKIVGGYTTSNHNISVTPGTTLTATPNSVITGTTGVNKVNFLEPLSNFSVSISGNSVTLKDNSGSLGVESLNNIQRLNFNDGQTLALDFQPGQNGFNASMLINTAFGSSKVNQYFPNAIVLIDSGQPLGQIAATVEQLGLIESQIGITTTNTTSNNKAWVDFVYNNVMGVLPDPATELYYMNLLSNGQSSRPQELSLAFNAATNGTTSNASQILLTGLQQNGLIFHALNS